MSLMSRPAIFFPLVGHGWSNQNKGKPLFSFA
jgi:hypothetical protein